jgi:hypothetical protein
MPVFLTPLRDLHPSSPFARTDLVPIDEDYSKKGLITGLYLPDGRILLNFESTSSVALINEIARTLGAKVVTVQGTWTFTPDRHDDENDSDHPTT